MPALDEHRLGSHVLHQRLCRVRHRIFVDDLLAGKNCCFVEIWCNERRLRDEVAPDHVDSIPLEQDITRGRHHHRVEYIVLQRVVTNRGGNARRDTGIRQHSSLECARNKILHDRIDLRPDEIGRQSFPPAHAASVLSCDCGNRRCSEDAESLKRLQIRLDAGAAAGVGARNCQRYTH